MALSLQAQELELASRAPVRPYWQRLDPYYMPQQSWSVDWKAHGSWQRREQPVARGQRQLARVWVEEFAEPSTRRFTRSLVLRRTVAFLYCWKHATIDQLTTFTGANPGEMRAVLRELWETGLVERTKIKHPGRLYNSPYFYRLRTGGELERYLESLSYEDWLAVTAASHPQEGNADKHNLIATELGLRLAETQPAPQAIYGESIAVASRMFPGTKAEFRGDIVFVREDGLRVVIEICMAPRHDSVPAKMARWARFLAERGTRDDHGTIVIFLGVVVDPAAPSGTAARQLRKQYASAITDEVIGGHDPTVVRTSILLADWETWFPGPWALSEAFAGLRATYTVDGRAWHLVEVAHGKKGGIPFRPTGGRWDEPYRTRSSLLCVPGWLGGPIQHRYTGAETDL